MARAYAATMQPQGLDQNSEHDFNDLLVHAQGSAPIAEPKVGLLALRRLVVLTILTALAIMLCDRLSGSETPRASQASPSVIAVAGR